MTTIKILFDIPTKKGKIRIPRLASQFKNVSENEEQFEIKITKKSFPKDAYFLSSLFYQVSGFKSTEIYIGKKPATKNQVQSLLQCCDCFIARMESPFPKEHCFCGSHKPGWGCKMLRWIARYDNDPHYKKNWHEVGSFTDNIQYIDKTEIFELIEKEADRKLLSLCPFFSLTKAEKLVKELPEQIDPRKDTLWEIRYAYDKGFKPVAVGVEPRGYEYDERGNIIGLTDSDIKSISEEQEEQG